MDSIIDFCLLEIFDMVAMAITFSASHLKSFLLNGKVWKTGLIYGDLQALLKDVSSNKCTSDELQLIRKT